jgi:hypothetical protein
MSDAFDTMFANMDKAPSAPDVSNALAAPPVSKPDVYDSMFSNMDRAGAVLATQNLLNAQGSNPDKAAKALQLSKQNGVPQPAVEQDLPNYEQQAQLKQNVDTLDQNPNLASFVAQNPLAARLAQDDFQKLGFIEKTWDALKSGTTGALQQNELGRLGNTKQVAGILGIDTPQTDQEIQAVGQQLQAQPKLTGGFGFVQNFTGFIGGLLDNAIKGGMTGAVAGAGAGAAAGAAAGGVGAIPGAAAGFAVGGTIGFNADMARVAAGNAYLKMGNMRGADGQQMSEPAKQFGALFTGAATYAVGTYAAAVESKLFGETAESLAQKALDQAVTRPTFTNAMATFAKGTATGAAQGAGIMTAMEGSSIIGEEIGKALSDGHFDTNKQEIIDRLTDAALNGAVMLGATHAAMHGIGLYGDFQAAQRSESNMQMFKNLQDGAASSKLRDRDSQAFQDFMQKQTDGSPVENIYIDANKIREFYQSVGIDPDQIQKVGDPFAFVPDMHQQLQEARDSGGDVVIPSADYLTHLSGTPLADHLLPDIRVGANAMSVNEAKAFHEEYQTRLNAASEVAANSADSAPSPTQGIFDDVKQQAVKAGYSETQANQHAAIYASRYAARAERLGVDPMEAYKQSGVEIQKADTVPAGEGRNFSQSMAEPIASHEITDKNGKSYDLKITPKTFGVDATKPNSLMVEVHDKESGARRGFVDFAIHDDGTVSAENAKVAPNFQGKGIAAEMYKAVQDAGYKIAPGRAHTEVGAKMVSALQKRGLITEPAKTLNQPTRGSITFSDGKALISIFKDGNASTLIHETGHLWLDELSKDAQIDGAPQQLKDDMATTLQWLGVDSADKIGVEQHEQFARAVEAYFMEGKSPTPALAGVFSRFKTWLTKIYQNVKNLNTQISDDIRGVFDRLLATDNEIDDAKANQGLQPAFKSKEEAGMTTAEWRSYTGAIDKANQMAESTMLDKMMAKVRHQRTAEYKTELTAIKEQIATEVDKRPDIQALQLVTKDRMPDGSTSESSWKLSRADIETTYGKEGVTNLPKGSTAKEGVHPDIAAEMLGYGSGDEMVKALQALEQQQREARLQDGEKRGIRQILIDQEAQSRMDEKHGDILDEKSMQDEAMAAIHSDKQTELLATELRYLKRMGAQALLERGKGRNAVKEVQTKADWDAAEADLLNQIKQAKTEAKIDELKQKLADLNMTNRWNDAERNTTQAALREATVITKPMLDAVRAHVATLLESKTVADIGNFNKYARDERKAAREVQDAILKKDWNAAAAAKQRQILSNILYVKAKEYSAQIDKDQGMMARLAAKKSFKNIAQEFTNQIHDLISRFGFDSGRGEELQRTKSGTLEEFVKQQSEDHGIELPVDQSLFNAAGGRVDDMKLSEFKALALAVHGMQEVGKSDMIINVDGAQRDFKEVKDEIVAQIRSLNERKQTDFMNPQSAPFWERKKEALFAAGRGTDALLVRMEELFSQIDQRDPFGILNTAIFRRMKDAEHNRNAWSEDTAKDFKAAADTMPKGWIKGLREVVPADEALIDPKTGRPIKILRKDLIGMILNRGNDGNITRAAEGYKWSKEAFTGYLDRHATKEDFDFAQKVWDAYDKYKKPLDDLQVRATGVGLDMVHADAFDTPYGKYEGGYYPIVEDKARSYRAEDNSNKETDKLFPSSYARATTPHGNTISRIGGQRPISFDLDIAPWKIGQTIHDIAMREALRDADRLLNHPDVKKAMDDVMGPEYRKLMRPWLQNIANSRSIDDAQLMGWNRILATARTNTVIVGIGFNAMTHFKHATTALSNSMGELGAKWMLAGTRELYGPGMTEKWQFIKDKSPDMAQRLQHYDQDVNGQYANLFKDSAYTKFQQQAQHFGHIGISYMDLGTAAPTWLGAYRKGLSENMQDADAVYYADQTVRNAHGGNGLVDKSAIQTKKGPIQMLTMFYNFFNHVYNRQRSIGIDASSGIGNLKAGDYKAASKDFGSVLARSWWYVAMPAFIEAFAQNQGPNQDKEETWAGWAAKAITAEIPAGIPVLRDIAKASIEGRDYEMSPVAKAVNTVIKSGRDIYQGIDEGEAPPNLAKHTAEAAGYLTGLPTAAPFRATKFLWDYTNGDADPHSIADWVQGLLKGKVPEH